MKRVLGMLLLFGVALSAFGQTATHTVVYSFSGGKTDGVNPYGPVIQAPDGNLYGMTPGGGANNAGVIYRVSPSGSETVLYSFPGGNAGGGSLGSLTLGSDGNLYGFASGGTYSSGQFFSLTMTGTFSSLYNFSGGTDGGGPQGAPVQGTDGNFYGAAATGGLGYGTIFKLTPGGIYTMLHEFNGVQDSGQPEGSLIEGSDGNFYGTANQSDTGLQYTVGAVYSITPAGVFTTLHNFTGGADGSNPDGAMVEGTDGSYYGTTHNGGSGVTSDDSGNGTIFKVTSAGVFTTLYTFTGGTDGAHPEGTLALGTDGNFYGTSLGNGNGNFFQITPAGALTVIHTFTGYSDGGQPLSGPLEGSDGNLYGTTYSGGSFLLGTVYKVTTATPLPVAVQLTTSASAVAIGVPFTLDWTVLNAASNTARQCVATVQGGSSNGGNWSGVQTGTVSGTAYSGSSIITPTGPGTFTYTLTCGGSESGFVTVTVAPLAITTTTLPNATSGSAYQQTLALTSGLSPFTWSVIGGSLPSGLSLSTSGTISGTPTLPGTYNFAVQVSDGESPVAAANAALTLTVVSSAPSIQATPSSFAMKAGSTGTTTLTVSGFSTSSIVLACSGLPAESSCSFSTPSGTSAVTTSVLQISTTAIFTTAELANRQHTGLELALLFPGGLLLFGCSRKARRTLRSRHGLLLVLAAMTTMSLVGCGGSSASGASSSPSASGTPTGTSTVTVTASAGSQTATTTLTLTIQ